MATNLAPLQNPLTFSASSTKCQRASLQPALLVAFLWHSCGIGMGQGPVLGLIARTGQGPIIGPIAKDG